MRLWSRFGFVCVALALSACKKGSVEASSGFTVRGLDAPSDVKSAALRCSERERCTSLSRGDHVGPGVVVKTARGAHATLDLEGGTTLDAGDDATFVLADASPKLAIDHGTLSIIATKKLDLALIDRVVTLEPGARADVRVESTDRALLTIDAGLAHVDGTPKTIEIGPGQTIAISPDAAIDERASWSAPPVDPARARRDVAIPSVAAPASDESADGPPKISSTPPRGLGAMTARIPGTEQIVGGVRLASHHAEVVVRDGYARTEIEEEFKNDGDHPLEGRFTFPVPPDATVSRLALWVGETLVEGEIVPKERAEQIFKAIVDDSVRPRDPALLEWTKRSEVSLKVYPIPAHGSRKVVLAFDQALSSAGGRVRYVHPLGLGDQSTKVSDFRVHVHATEGGARIGDLQTPHYPAMIGHDDGAADVTFASKDFRPDDDFVVSYARELNEKKPIAQASAYVPASDEKEKDGDAFAAVRFTVDLPEGTELPARVKRDRAFAVDASFSQSKESYDVEIAIAKRLLAEMDASERFVVLACDSVCASFPDDGTSAADEDAKKSAIRFLEEHTPAGSSNLSAAIADAAKRLDGSTSGQVIYLGDGAPSAGDLSPGAIVDHARRTLGDRKLDLRFLGTGRSVDESTLEAVARGLGGAYERVANGDAIEERLDALAIDLRRPVIEGARLELPEGLHDVYPRELANLRVGEEVTLLGRLADTSKDAKLTLRGKMAGREVTLERKVSFAGELAQKNPLVPRLWASARIADLATSDDKTAKDETIALSTRWHVMSRQTALLVLENDRMYSEFGIKRTTKRAEDQSDQSFSLPLIEAPVVPWGRDSSQGSDPLSARGNMWGNDIDDSFGRGGLGLSGVGEGGGGKGESIGLGSIGTIGHGAGTGQGQGFGSGSGRLSGSHKIAAPTVRMMGAAVSGRLPPEVIQRIVRQQFGRMRLCYERGLMTNPALAGRVTVRFVIGRDGTSMTPANAGSSLADASVVACVVKVFDGMAFPQPDGGIVTVSYPIELAPADAKASETVTPPQRPVKPATLADRHMAWGPTTPVGFQPVPDWVGSIPTATSVADDAKWMRSGQASIAKLRSDAAASPSSRSKRDALVRGLLLHGFFDDALDEAEKLATDDPDAKNARELVAFARAIKGEGEKALAAIDALVETDPRSHNAQVRAARAFEASGDEKRACAHWRSAAELQPNGDDARYETIRCRARADGDREGALAEARSIEKPGPKTKKLIETLASGAPSGHDETDLSAGAFAATIACSGDAACPTIVVLAPNGAVMSPWTPTLARTTSSQIAIASLRSGVYRTMLVGGAADARGEITVRALGNTRKFTFTRGGLQAVAATTVENI